MSNETLRETLLFQPKHGYDRSDPGPDKLKWSPTARTTRPLWTRPKPSGRL